jgi:hypothetical protein
MHVRAAKDRDHHARKRRRPLIKKTPGDPIMIYVVATSQVEPETRDEIISNGKVEKL